MGAMAQLGASALAILRTRLELASVEFAEAPEERPYGIDAAFRDPSGNNIRLVEQREITSS